MTSEVRREADVYPVLGSIFDYLNIVDVAPSAKICFLHSERQSVHGCVMDHSPILKVKGIIYLPVPYLLSPRSSFKSSISPRATPRSISSCKPQRLGFVHLKSGMAKGFLNQRSLRPRKRRYRLSSNS